MVSRLDTDRYLVPVPSTSEPIPAGECILLGGMLRGDERWIRSGANVDWSMPFTEALSSALIDAWERHGCESDEQWLCASAALITYRIGTSPILDHDLALVLLGLRRAWKVWYAGIEEQIEAARMEQEEGQ